MNERSAEIIARARRTLELAKAERADVLADLERRELNDQTIPTLPVDRSQLVYKRYDDAKVTTRATPVTATTTPEMLTQEWQDYIAAEIDAAEWRVYQVVADQLMERDEHVKGLESEVKALRDKLASRTKPRKPKQLTISEPFLRLKSSNAA